MTIIYFLLVFSILVLVHELGHFLVAKKLGLTVHEFGFGFPPRLFGWRRGETLYSINALPLGGFVRIKGEEGEAPDAPDSFASRPVWQRSAVIVAGVAMNVVLGWFLFVGGFVVGAPTIVDDSIPIAYVRNPELTIRSILPHAPVTTQDVRANDIILSVEGKSVIRVADLQEALSDRDGKETEFAIKRDGAVLTRTITPAYIPEAERVGIGVGLDTIGVVRYPFFIAIGKGTMLTGFMLKEITVGFWSLLRDLVVAQRVSVDLSGPVGIAVLTGRIAKTGIAYLIQFIALLSLNLAVLNLLPIPALDGGRFLFTLIEKIRGKAIDYRTEAVIHRIGLVLLLLLVLLVTYKDIVRLVAKS